MSKQNLNFIISHIKRTETPYNMPSRHYHDLFEIYYLLDGERYYFIDDRTYYVKKGDVVIINKNILHKTNTTDRHAHERILLQFDTKLIDEFKENFNDIDLYYCFKTKQNVYSLDPEEQLWIENHLFNILQEKNKKDEGYFTYIKILILELLVFLTRIGKSATPYPNTYLDQTHEKISEVASFINSHYNDELSLNKVAAHFSYSPTYLSKAFKKVTGFKFVEYKNHVRIKEASKLLQNSRLNITEIALQVGYNNLTHFGRIFKEITGYSPLEYRKMKKNT